MKLGTLLQHLFRVAALAIIFITFAILVPRGAFVTPENIENILKQSAVYTLAGLGMTMVILTGGIDLSAGSTIAISMACTALTLNYQHGEMLAHHPFLWTCLAVIVGTGVGAGFGLFQGSLITTLRIPAFIVTLGGLVSIRAIAKGIADNQTVSPPEENWLYKNLMPVVQTREAFNWQLVPLGVWFVIAMAVLAALMLRYTKLGRHIYAVGSNESAARLCGVPVVRTKLAVYAIAGVFAGLAGVLEFSKLNLSSPNDATMYELYIIAACVIGGTSLRGGTGGIFGTVIGALTIVTLYTGAAQAGWPKWVQELVIGPIIIAAVALDRLRTKERA
jgi:ribose/xylose/arabinose/galactoside ABC-type transport system permease subunit